MVQTTYLAFSRIVQTSRQSEFYGTNYSAFLKVVQTSRQLAFYDTNYLAIFEIKSSENFSSIGNLWYKLLGNFQN